MSPFPLVESSLCHFVAFLSTNGLSHSSLSAIHFTQIALGGQQLQYVKRGLSRQRPDHTCPKRLPIIPEILSTLWGSWSRAPITYNKVMLRAACCLGYFAFLWSGEFTSSALASSPLEQSDIAVNDRSNPSYITVFLCRSKTDQGGIGTAIYIGRTQGRICPVVAVLDYLARRPSTPGPLFILDNGAPLSWAYLVQSVRETLANAGVSTTGYSGHSFRVGAASPAASAGLLDSTIQSLGR